MANQWGRDSGFQSGGKKGRGGLTGIAMLLCLVIGAAGGYAAMRFIQPDSDIVIEDTSAELARLNEALVQSRQEAAEARNMQAESAAQVEDLTAQAARQAADQDAMVEKLAANSSVAQVSEVDNAAVEGLRQERDALAEENRTLKANLAAVEAELTSQRRSLTAAEEELARLQNEVLPQLTAERDQLEQKASMMLTDHENLKARASAAEQTHASDTARIAELETRLAEAERELAASQEVLDGLKLEERVADQPDALAQSDVAEAGQEPADDTASMRNAREPNAVAQALRTAPGLGTLSDVGRKSLTDRLVAGECVTTALKSVFERVPILTLRNLIRDLNSDC